MHDPERFLSDSEMRRFRLAILLALVLEIIVLVSRGVGMDTMVYLWMPPSLLAVILLAIVVYFMPPWIWFLWLPGSGSISRDWAETLPIALVASGVTAVYLLLLTGAQRATDVALSVLAAAIITPGVFWWYQRFRGD